MPSSRGVIYLAWYRRLWYYLTDGPREAACSPDLTEVVEGEGPC